MKAQKAHTFMIGKNVFHTPFSNKPWTSPFQIRHSGWLPILRRAGVRYRNPYQTRHTYASMMLSKGENIMWVAKQMGHANIEMVIKTYGKWIPDNSAAAGYKPVHDWGTHMHLEKTFCPVYAPRASETENFEEKIEYNQIYRLASLRGFESLSDESDDPSKTIKNNERQ